MLLNEVFQTYSENTTKYQPTHPVITIPLKFISVSPESMAALTERKKKKINVLASQLRKGIVTDLPPLQVQKTQRGFVLLHGLLKYLAAQKAGIYALSAEVLPADAITEDRERFIIYINDKPNAYFDSKIEAEKQAAVIKTKYPTAQIEVKPGIIKN